MLPLAYARPFAKPATLPARPPAPPKLAKPAAAPAPKAFTPPAASAPRRVVDSFQPARPTAAPVAAKAPPPTSSVRGTPASQVKGMVQTHRVEGTKIYAETAVRIPAGIDQVKSAVQGDWSKWWQHSDVSNLKKSPDGASSFGFKPLAVDGHGPTALDVSIAAPRSETLANGNQKLTLDVQLKGDFNGKARMELEQDGKETVVRSIWEGVEPAGWKKLVPDLVAGMHMRVEKGGVPGAKNTGFPGMIEYLAKGDPATSADQKFKQALDPSFPGFKTGQAESSAKRAASDGDGIRSFNQVGSDGKVNSRTEVVLPSSPEKVKSAIQGDWSQWWEHSAVKDRTADGKSFTINPLGKMLGLGPAVGIQMGDPKETVENGLKKIRIDAKFSGDFSGNGYIEIQQQPDGQSKLSFNWPDFQVTGALKHAPGIAIGAHTRTLEGDTPGFNGTGLEGLRNYLKK